MAGEKWEDFWHHRPSGQFIFLPSRELWPRASVDAALPRVPVVDASGKPIINKKTGEPKTVGASVKIARGRAVQQMTWAPGEPIIIADRLIAEGGWIARKDMKCCNLYRPPPQLTGGNPKKAKPWLDHIHKVYPDDVEHITTWCAHRVQRPHEKINHALVLGGAQGIGKDTLLEPVKIAIGHWNFQEIGPTQLLGRFNGFLKRVILRVNEARDLGEVNRYAFYDHMKPIIASPPGVLRVDEKNLHEYNIINVVGIVVTTNHRDGVYLPPDDRRHYVAWSELEKEAFPPDYWPKLYHWYENEHGYAHVGAYLGKLDLSNFDAKAPPPKTEAWHAMVNVNRAPEEAELADVLDRLGNPGATTLNEIIDEAPAFSDFHKWLEDRKNRRAIPHRLEAVGYIPFRNPHTKDGHWEVGGVRCVVYVDKRLIPEDAFKAVAALHRRVDAKTAGRQQKAAEKAANKGKNRSRGVRF